MNQTQLHESFLLTRCNAMAFSLDDALHNVAISNGSPLEVIHIERDQSWFHVRFIHSIYVGVTVFVPPDLNFDSDRSVFELRLIGPTTNMEYELFDSSDAIIHRIIELSTSKL